MSIKHLFIVLFCSAGLFTHQRSRAQGATSSQAAVISGSLSESVGSEAVYAPTNLIAGASGADFAILTNYCPVGYRGDSFCYGVQLSAKQLVDLKTAVAALSAPVGPQPYAGPGEFWLLFYRGTNCVARASIGDELLFCDEGQFSDRTGIIRTITHENGKWMYEAYVKWEERLRKRNDTLSPAGVH